MLWPEPSSITPSTAPLAAEIKRSSSIGPPEGQIRLTTYLLEVAERLQGLALLVSKFFRFAVLRAVGLLPF